MQIMNKSWTFKKGKERNRVGCGNPEREKRHVPCMRRPGKFCMETPVCGEGEVSSGGTEHRDSTTELLKPPGFCPTKGCIEEKRVSEEEETSDKGGWKSERMSPASAAKYSPRERARKIHGMAW